MQASDCAVFTAKPRIFGTQTATAVSTFQRAHNLKADGLAGKQTLSALYAANAKPYSTPKPRKQPPQSGGG